MCVIQEENCVNGLPKTMCAVAISTNPSGLVITLSAMVEENRLFCLPGPDGPWVSEFTDASVIDKPPGFIRRFDYKKKN